MKDGSEAAVDASIRLISESQEESNVNMVSSLVQMIELSRRFEMDIKTMQAAQENDEVGTRILSMS
jgi:flagellar basal-body rod protein FlgF